jgi:hypothetical protein
MPDAGTKTDAAAAPKYSAMMPDAGAKDTGGAVALYMAMMPDGGAVLRYMAVMPPEAGVAQPDYMAVMPVDAASRDAGPGPVLLYMAPMPTKN